MTRTSHTTHLRAARPIIALSLLAAIGTACAGCHGDSGAAATTAPSSNGPGNNSSYTNQAKSHGIQPPKGAPGNP